MMLLYALKGTCAAAAFAAGELVAHGHVALAAASVPMVALMAYATRLHARRRARGGER